MGKKNKMWIRKAERMKLKIVKIKLEVSRLMFYDVENIRDRIDGMRIDRWMLRKYKEVLYDMEFRATTLINRAYNIDTILI